MRGLVALCALLLCVGFAAEASAHAALVSVEPASGSVLASAPKAVELRFNEAVTPGAIRLIDGAGDPRDVRLCSSVDLSNASLRRSHPTPPD